MTKELEFLQKYDVQDNLVSDNSEGAFYISDLLKTHLSEQLFIHVVSISLLKKYIQHVENCEGVNFVSYIGMSCSGIEFSKEEKALLEKLDAEIK